jgi:UDP-glucose 4-epimerase
MVKSKNWLITGGCGFIGTNLIARLKKEHPEYKIRVLDNLLVGTKKDLSEVSEFTEIGLQDISDPTDNTEVKLAVGDIKDYKTCLSCAKGVDVIVHLAASTGVPLSVENPRIDMEANVIGTFNMLEAAGTHGVKKFIFASSGAPIGEVTPPIHEDLAPHPVSPYGASKLAGEGYCSAYHKTFGIETTALRFGNVYGPRSSHKSSVVAKFIRQALKGETLEIFGDRK